MMGVKFECRNCGCDVFWDVNRNGKRYLAQQTERYYTGSSMATWTQPHYCNESLVKSHTESRQARAAQLVQAYTDGAIVVQQTVTVVKGRKILIGTTGVVFWVAPQPDQYGVTKVGFTTATGDTHFININNIQTTQQGDNK